MGWERREEEGMMGWDGMGFNFSRGLLKIPPVDLVMVLSFQWDLANDNNRVIYSYHTSVGPTTALSCQVTDNCDGNAQCSW